MSDMLFPLPDAREPRVETTPAPPRVQRPDRRQVELRPLDLEALLPDDHRARVVWAFVEGLDLTPFYAAIKAVEGQAGRPPIDPAILMALWLYATLEGVGSARAVARLCEEHHAYRWLCGGVSVNYHTLADFRVGHPEVLDGVLTRSLASLVAALRDQVEADPGALSRRQAAARHRAAEERRQRVTEALAQLPALEARRRKAGVKGPARLSTTDPDARVMKMPDGGYRPAFNAQFMTTTQGQIIVGVAVTNAGTDHGQLHPMVEQVQQRYGQAPTEVLADGGYVDLDDLRALAAARGCQVYAPPPGRADPTRAERPCWRPDDAMVAEWRQRMYSAAGQAVYRERGATSECINAQARNRGLRHLLVRGLRKVRAVLLWFALAHNLLGAVRLRAAAALGP